MTPRIITVPTRCWSKREGKWLEASVTVRLCDVEGCNDSGATWRFPGNRCYCDKHRHLVEVAS